MSQTNVYNLNPTEDGVLIDKRLDGASTTKFRLKRNDNDVYLTSQLPYVYGLKQNQDTVDYSTTNLFDIEQISSNGCILLDDEGYPMFSKTLLTKYGIGFLLSNWIVRDGDSFKIKFHRKYINSCFYDYDFYINNLPKDEYPYETFDDIYSFKNFFKYKYKVAVSKYPNPDYDPDDPEKGPEKITTYQYTYLLPNLRGAGGGVREENIIRGVLENYEDVDYEKNPFKSDSYTIKLSDEDWKKFLLSRRYLGTAKFYRIYVWDNKVSLKEWSMNYTTTTPEPDFRQFLVPQIVKDNNGNVRYFFYVCQCTHYDNQPSYPTIEEVFDIIENDEAHPLKKYDKLNLAYWKTVKNDAGEPQEVLYCYNNNAYQNSYLNAVRMQQYSPMKYNIHDTNYTDYETQTVAEDSAAKTDIVRELLYVLIMTKTKDMFPYEFIPGTTDQYTYKKYSEYAFDKEVVNPYETLIENQKEAEQALEEALADTSIKWQTPAEYYSNNMSVTDNNVENPFGISNQVWFWVDSLKNWCRYNYTAGILQLTCWNGRNGWDNVGELVTLKNVMYWIPLYNKYFYSHSFFIEGPAYTNQGSDFIPMRYPNGPVGQAYYRTIMLHRDTTVLNYNEKFQSMHDTKTYQTGERNTKSNAGIGAFGKYTNAGNPIYVDETRRAIHGVPTQYCPVIFKLTNGNLALSYYYSVNTNGYGVFTDEYPFQLISPDEANERCRDVFGDGTDKTIFKDWKRFNTTDTSEEFATEIKFDNEETLYNAMSLNRVYGSKKINNIKLFANRPNPTTNNSDIQDYLERWDR